MTTAERILRESTRDHVSPAVKIEDETCWYSKKSRADGTCLSRYDFPDRSSILTNGSRWADGTGVCFHFAAEGCGCMENPKC